MMCVYERIKNYATRCVNGDEVSCQKHKWACMRFLRDADEYERGDSRYYWDEESAENIIKWFSLLRHSKGELAGHPIILTDWQVFNICQLYGWRLKENNRRRFRKFFNFVARKNAKSQELAGILLYECSVTSTKNHEVAEIYTAGTKREQSKIVFNECKLMLNGSPLRKKFKITQSSIVHIKSGSFIRPLSKDDGKNGGDGTCPASLCLDEYHQHRTTEFYDLSIGSNSKEPLLLIITTAGIDLAVPCYREYEFCSNVINPSSDVNDDEYLIDICEQDEEDYRNPQTLMNEDLWVKSNPIRATYTEGRSLIRTTYEKALKVPEDLPACLTKNFNVWVQAKSGGYMDMAKWKRCEVKELPISLNGMDCVVGIDIASKIDLASAAIVIPFDSDELDAECNAVKKYIVMQHSFIPNRDKMKERVTVDRVPYDAWEQMGLVTVTDSDVVDQLIIMLWVIDFTDRLGLRRAMWSIDPTNAALFETMLDYKGEKVFEVYQSYAGLNDPTVAFREEVYMQHIIYTPDPLLNFCMGNAIVKKSDGRIKIDKDMRKNKIDPVDAVICAFKYAMTMKTYASQQRQLENSIDDWLTNF